MRTDSIKAFAECSSDMGNIVRAIGASADYSDEIRAMDIQCGFNAYCRITGFPIISDTKDIAFYSDGYNNLCEGKYNSIFRNLADSENTIAAARACITVCDEVKAAKNGMNDTMVKNLAVSLLYWLDMMTAPLIASSERVKKFVCSGKIGYKEYAFCMVLAKLGVQVMILLPQGDISVLPQLDKSSYAFRVGELTADVPEYAVQEIKRADIKTVQPPVTETKNTSDCGQRELSFEELAQLAESVVMIFIKDKKGKTIGSGSGIAISRDGYILTNCHVAGMGKNYSVQIENDDKLYDEVQLIKYHPPLDLAVMRVNRELVPLKISDGSRAMARGQKIAAIGSPMGLFNTVSNGIISGFREIGDMSMIQFTAPVSGGSSGGAVLNMFGEVIGITTAGMEGGQNINFAVSCSQILPFIKGFI